MQILAVLKKELKLTIIFNYQLYCQTSTIYILFRPPFNKNLLNFVYAFLL